MTASSVVGSRHSLNREQEPLKPRCATSQVASQRSLTPSGAPPSGIEVISIQDGTSQDVKAIVQEMVKSSLTELGVIPQDIPTQSQAHSPTVDPEHPQIEDISEGGDFQP